LTAEKCSASSPSRIAEGVFSGSLKNTAQRAELSATDHGVQIVHDVAGRAAIKNGHGRTAPQQAFRYARAARQPLWGTDLAVPNRLMLRRDPFS